MAPASCLADSKVVTVTAPASPKGLGIGGDENLIKPEVGARMAFRKGDERPGPSKATCNGCCNATYSAKSAGVVA